MFVGILLLALGVIMMLQRLGIIYGDVWDYILPVALVALGVSFISDHKRKRR